VLGKLIADIVIVTRIDRLARRFRDWADRCP